MAWIIAVDGISFIISNIDDPHETETEIKSIDEYKSLKKQASELGLILSTTVDTDQESLTIFIGKELHPDRHLYAGQTVTGQKSNSDEFNTISGLSEKLRSLLDPMFSVESKTGIVISQFD